jgi:hypothetical protein
MVFPESVVPGDSREKKEFAQDLKTLHNPIENGFSPEGCQDTKLKLTSICS